jgi:magnesium chelatase family protein
VLWQQTPTSGVNALTLGPSGASPPRLIRGLTHILPLRTLAETIETTRIHSDAGLTGGRTALDRTRPFRGPHHTISDAGLISGGQVPMPGEVSMAHHGIFFLSELSEFRRHVLKVLRQPVKVQRNRNPVRESYTGLGKGSSPR